MLWLFWLVLKLCCWLLVTVLTVARGVAAYYLYVLFNTDYTSTVGRATAFLLFATACLTDAIDGPVARKFNVVSGLGKILDPLCDKMLCWVVLLYMVRPQFDSIPSIQVWLLIPYAIIAGYDFSTLAFRILKACGYKLNMETSQIAKQRTILLQLLLGACLSFGVVQAWLAPGAQVVALIGLFFGGVYVMWYTYLSGREYLLTVRPWELFGVPR